ncbi:MAG: hypothetical protein HY700_13885 [Gemmatimonadetes bacterium]|nr:hypothetical protein [Gemmatimonadota bacterium]
MSWAYAAPATTLLTASRCACGSITSASAVALAARRSSWGLLHHSDRGSQYTGAAYQQLLAAQSRCR